MKYNMIVGQSGGPTAVINGSLYGVVSAGLDHPQVEHVYGMINGIEGFLQDNWMDMSTLKKEGTLSLLKTTPGAYLGSCRYKLPEDLKEAVFKELFAKLDAMNIRYFFYIGGNDSMDTVNKLSSYAQTIQSPIRFIGIPKTIDNDLVLTDHTPGFGSAAKYVASTVREIALDASVYDNKPSVTIVEIMGRHAGWLAASSVLARKYPLDNPRLIYLPETDFSVEDFIGHLQNAMKETKNVVVCISEGIHDKEGRFLCEYASKVGTDTFGHKMLTGSGKYLETLVAERLQVKVRSVELNVSQRASASLLSGTDLEESIGAGKFGLMSALLGETGKMVAFCRDSHSPYVMHYELRDVAQICNKEQAVPQNYIAAGGFDVTDEFIAYASPLIQGNVPLPYKDGLPLFLYRKPARS